MPWTIILSSVVIVGLAIFWVWDWVRSLRAGRPTLHKRTLQPSVGRSTPISVLNPEPKPVPSQETNEDPKGTRPTSVKTGPPIKQVPLRRDIRAVFESCFRVSCFSLASMLSFSFHLVLELSKDCLFRRPEDRLSPSRKAGNSCEPATRRSNRVPRTFSSSSRTRQWPLQPRR